MKALSTILNFVPVHLFISLVVFNVLPVVAQEVTLYSHRHYEADEKLYEKFTKDTGIKVNVVKASADALIVAVSAPPQATSKTHAAELIRDCLIMAFI